MSQSVSVILPAKNEADAIGAVIQGIRARLADAEILVINDGSTDATARVAEEAGARVLSHPYSMGNGAAVKHGARAAAGDILVFLDADGQHDPDDIPRLLERLDSGYDMVVGARGKRDHASRGRGIANRIYNRVATYMTGHPIQDLTSGFRAVRARKFREFLNLLPNGFSYPTTITMAFFRAGYLVTYEPISVRLRQTEQQSHIRPMHDGLRFLLIIFKVGTLYSPMKIFAPVSGLYLVLGLGYYLYTYISQGRFTNMSALLFTTAIVVFLIGLISEQITALLYRPSR